jgi:hypothetical protein
MWGPENQRFVVIKLNKVATKKDSMESKSGPNVTSKRTNYIRKRVERTGPNSARFEEVREEGRWSAMIPANCLMSIGKLCLVPHGLGKGFMNCVRNRGSW